MAKAIIIMGSKTDMEWSGRIAESLAEFGVKASLRIASAHKVPLRCYELIKEQEGEATVFITVAGRSNALSGFADGQTYCPVIACPPYSSTFAGADVYSSLRMPSGVAPMVVLEPQNAALAAAKILAVGDGAIRAKVQAYQEQLKAGLERDDEEAQSDG